MSRLAEADIDNALDIESDSFSVPWDRASFERELSEENAHCLVIRKRRPKEPDRVIAYLCFRLNRLQVYITNLAVDPAYRRRGVATFLLGYSLGLAKGRSAEKALLEVRESNHAAIQLYKKVGFCETGRREGHYFETEESAVVMVKELT